MIRQLVLAIGIPLLVMVLLLAVLALQRGTLPTATGSLFNRPI